MSGNPTNFVNDTKDGVQLQFTGLGGSWNFGTVTNPQTLSPTINVNGKLPWLNPMPACGPKSNSQCTMVQVFSTNSGLALNQPTSFTPGVSSISISSLIPASISTWPLALKLTLLPTLPVFVLTILYMIAISGRITGFANLFLFTIPALCVFIPTVLIYAGICSKMQDGSLKQTNPYILALIPTLISMGIAYIAYFFLVGKERHSNVSLESARALWQKKYEKAKESKEYLKLKVQDPNNLTALANYLKQEAGAKPTSVEDHVTSGFGGGSNQLLYAAMTAVAIYYGNVIAMEQILETCIKTA